MVRKFYHIVWLLEETQKTDSAITVDIEREIKRVRTLSNPAEKSDTVVKF